MIPTLMCVFNALGIWSSGNSLINRDNQTKGEKALDVVVLSLSSIGFVTAVYWQMLSK